MFLAFARVFSGVLREGASVQVLSAAYSPARPGELRQEGRVAGLYLMMGRGLERLQVLSTSHMHPSQVIS